MKESKRLQTTVDVGNDLRDRVASLLRTRYGDVQVEATVGGKAVDIVYNDVAYGRTIKVGVECKNYGRSLTATELTRDILPDYQSLVDEQLLHTVLIVSNHPLGPAAVARLAGKRDINYLTYEQLEEHLIGFNDYVRDLSSLFELDNLASYYVESRFNRDNFSALQRILNWMSEEGAPPLAIPAVTDKVRPVWH